MADSSLAQAAAAPRAAETRDGGRSLGAVLGRHADSLALLVALALSMLFAVRNMEPVLQPGRVVQDDARQHLFWMARYRDPRLFQNDPMAEYYESLAPPGHRALYWLASRVVDPERASRLVGPAASATAVIFSYLLLRRLGGGVGAGLLGSVLVAWYAWQYDHLPSGTPRAYMLPLLAAQLWAVAEHRRVLALGVAVLSALLYPPAAALCLGVLGLGLVSWHGRRPALSRTRADWLLFAAACLLVVVAVLPVRTTDARFGPQVSLEQARALPEFQQGGRESFFMSNPYLYWVRSRRSGLATHAEDPLFESSVPILFELAALAALLPLGVLVYRRQGRSTGLRPEGVVLARLLVASLVLFFLAHLVLFRLYLPSRYVSISLPLAFGLAAGLGLELVVRGVVWLLRLPRRSLAMSGLAAALALGVAFYPADYYGSFREDRRPAVTRWLQTQPPDTLVAGLPIDADLVPSFARRSVVASIEYAIPFHLGYYGEMKRRLEDLLAAFYSSDRAKVERFADRYGVDVFLVNSMAYQAGNVDRVITSVDGGRFEPFSSQASRALRELKGEAALVGAARRCASLIDEDVAVVTRKCLGSSG